MQGFVTDSQSDQRHLSLMEMNVLMWINTNVATHQNVRFIHEGLVCQLMSMLQLGRWDSQWMNILWHSEDIVGICESSLKLLKILTELGFEKNAINISYLSASLDSVELKKH